LLIGVTRNNAAASLLGLEERNSHELEEASTHKSAHTYAGNVFVTRDLDL